MFKMKLSSALPPSLVVKFSTPWLSLKLEPLHYLHLPCVQWSLEYWCPQSFSENISFLIFWSDVRCAEKPHIQLFLEKASAYVYMLHSSMLYRIKSTTNRWFLITKLLNGQRNIEFKSSKILLIHIALSQCSQFWNSWWPRYHPMFITYITSQECTNPAIN